MLYSIENIRQAVGLELYSTGTLFAAGFPRYTVRYEYWQFRFIDEGLEYTTVRGVVPVRYAYSSALSYVGRVLTHFRSGTVRVFDVEWYEYEYILY